MDGDRIWALSATAVALVTAVLALWAYIRFRREQRRYPRITGPAQVVRGTWTAPSPDPGRYQVVFHFNGETRQVYQGYDPIQARHAYEQAPMEAGMQVEFYEWGQRRGKKEA